jgi:DNA-binding transcriptional LysR family regulator
MEIEGPAAYPSLLVDSNFALRRCLDAACRLAGLRPRVFLESTTPHTLVALAEGKHGVAIIPSQFRLRNHDPRVVGLTFNGKLLRERMMLLWDKRRPLPACVMAYSKMLAEHVRHVFPITRPSGRRR